MGCLLLVAIPGTGWDSVAYLEHEHAVGGAGEPDVPRGFPADSLVAGKKASPGSDPSRSGRTKVFRHRGNHSIISTSGGGSSSTTVLLRGTIVNSTK